jgi:hypothetical protein
LVEEPPDEPALAAAGEAQENVVAGTGVRGHPQLPHAGKGADGVVEEAVVGEQREEGVDDGR